MLLADSNRNYTTDVQLSSTTKPELMRASLLIPLHAGLRTGLAQELCPCPANTLSIL